MAGARSYLALIVKPTYDCNMECAYCSVVGHDTLPRMSTETVDLILDRVTAFLDKSTPAHFVWHGGEPLLMPPDFYEHVGRRTREYPDHCITNGIQSNATLLNDRYIDVIVEYGFRFSTSLDGPAHVHNRSRRFNTNAPTFDEVMTGLRKLTAQGVTVGAVAVLSKLNLDAIDEIYEFFSSENINFRINPVLFYGRAAQQYRHVALKPREYGRAMARLFDLWYNDPDTSIIVDPLYTFLGNVATGLNQSCDCRRQCHAEVISIGPRAEVYPCGQFHGSKNFYLGNLYQDDFPKIMASSSMQELLERVPENVSPCDRCEFQEICNCGCTASAVCRRERVLDPDYYCSGRKAIFERIVETVESDLENSKLRLTPQ